MPNILHWEGQPNNKYKATGVWNNKYSIMINKIEVIIEVERQLAVKKIIITTKEDKVDLLQVLLVLLRFENLYEGYFYNTQILEIDNLNCIEKERDWLPYYRSECWWMMVPNLSMAFDLSLLFQRWYEKVEELGIIHQMFLYTAYANDLTPDVKLAFILQTFEPITKELEKKKKIKIVPHNHKNVGNNRIVFQDRVYALLLKYKELLFSKDNIDVLAEKSSNLRNRVVHLDREKKDFLSGKEAAYYLQKVIMMYTILIFDILDFEENKYIAMIEEAVQKYEKRFQFLSIR